MSELITLLKKLTSEKETCINTVNELLGTHINIDVGIFELISLIVDALIKKQV